MIPCQLTTYQHREGRGSLTKLTFDERSQDALTKDLKKKEVFEKRVKIIILIATALLLIGGVTGVGLAITIIPYCLLHTVLVAGGTSVGTLGFFGFFGSLFEAEMITPFTSFYTQIKEQCQSYKGVVRITNRESWKYLSDFHREYGKKLEKESDDAAKKFFQDHDVVSMSRIVGDYLETPVENH